MSVAVTGLVVVAGAALFFWLVPNFILSKLGSVNEYRAEAGAGRPTLWKDSAGIFRDHPVIGAGMGSFVTVYPPYQSSAQDLITEHAHNDYVEALTETGILGGVVILAALVLFFRIAFGNLYVQLKRETGWMQLGARDLVLRIDRPQPCGLQSAHSCQRGLVRILRRARESFGPSDPSTVMNNLNPTVRIRGYAVGGWVNLTLPR